MSDSIICNLSPNGDIIKCVMIPIISDIVPQGKGDHYTAQLNYTAVMTQVETKEAQT